MRRRLSWWGVLGVRMVAWERDLGGFVRWIRERDIVWGEIDQKWVFDES